MKLRLTIALNILFALALAAALYRSGGRAVYPLSSDDVRMQSTVTGTKGTSAAGDYFLPRAGASVHAASLAQLPDGTVVAVWFAGAREGAGDVAVYLSRFRNGSWSQAIQVATPQQTQADTARFVRKVGNAILGTDGNGRLHLWYVSCSIGGWSTAALNHRCSDDGGATWSKARRLVTAPVGNMSTLVRCAPLPLQNGGFGIPTYHEFATKHGEFLQVAADGSVVNKVRMPASRPLLQPAVAPLPQEHALLALLRDAGKGPGSIQVARLDEGSRRWRKLPPLPIANPNSGIALLRLTDGRLLLACNPLATGRNRLSLWLSAGDGRSWQEILLMEKSDTGSDEFSYPALLQDNQGMIHLLYTWKRRQIRHRILDPARLEQEQKS